MEMHRRFFLLYLVLSILLITGCSQPDIKLEARSSHYFPETGYIVQGEFFEFFNRYGGVESLGYPLSEPMVIDGWQVQYFENGRLEYHPENEPAYRVTVGWLGDILHRRRPPLPAPAIPARHNARSRYYAQTGHTLSGTFLAYFDGHGGSVRFGLPISEPFIWEGALVQDFQSARLIWSPEAPGMVRLEKTGQLHLEIIKATIRSQTLFGNE
jgi:hypothetical protein